MITPVEKTAEGGEMKNLDINAAVTGGILKNNDIE